MAKEAHHRVEQTRMTAPEMPEFKSVPPKTLRHLIGVPEAEYNLLIAERDRLQAEVTRLSGETHCCMSCEGYTKEAERLRAEVEALKNADECDAGTILEVFKDRDALKAKATKYREALELLCYSVVGTEGTKTNSELPEWYRNRLKEANKLLAPEGEKA